MFVISFFFCLVACVAAAIIDHRTGEIPDRLTYTLIATGFAFAILSQTLQVLVFFPLLFYIGYFLYQLRAIGGGDVKLLTGLALFSPTPNVFLWWGTIFCVSYALVCAYTFLRKNRDGRERFGVFILVGFLVAAATTIPI